jgi:hypothetical protein
VVDRVLNDPYLVEEPVSVDASAMVASNPATRMTPSSLLARRGVLMRFLPMTGRVGKMIQGPPRRGAQPGWGWPCNEESPQRPSQPAIRPHNCAPIDHITSVPTVGRDLRKRRSAQRFPAVS